LDVSPSAFEILTHLARKQIVFTTRTGGAPCDINAIYKLTPLKSTFNRLNIWR